MRNPYEILGVAETASQGEIRQAYRKLAQRFHPDRAEGDLEHFQDIGWAYEQIGTPAARVAWAEQRPSAEFLAELEKKKAIVRAQRLLLQMLKTVPLEPQPATWLSKVKQSVADLHREETRELGKLQQKLKEDQKRIKSLQLSFGLVDGADIPDLLHIALEERIADLEKQIQGRQQGLKDLAAVQELLTKFYVTEKGWELGAAGQEEFQAKELDKLKQLLAAFGGKRL